MQRGLSTLYPHPPCCQRALTLSCEWKPRHPVSLDPKGLEAIEGVAGLQPEVTSVKSLSEPARAYTPSLRRLSTDLHPALEVGF